ncbi:DUF3833 domain-containing protein [Aestuariispira insulae]|uniref:Uncharacterized protein DUF3833 n=1 Tax=Aestuariispira insulae TaxID=1461337 RepID=A0A3D9H8H8_9PROT|nr:DUF3833 domain-containing protein [Aestuariispira insulae]RED45793.1 uncharacterized protein DUF3833 [Aestuariispira insulae]
MKRVLMAFFAILAIQGCSGMQPEDFAGQEPELDLFEYFDGQTQAWGWFEDRFGTVRRQFHVSISGTIDDGVLTLDEDFTYRDGERSKRVWRIRKDGKSGYAGEADDVIGRATGRVSGNALNWRYTLALPIGDNVWHVQFDDWMFLQENGILLNRAVVRKWGLELGRVSIFFSKGKDVS